MAVASSSQATTAGTLRILLAEENPINQKVALRLLERLGYEADIASDGQEVLERLERAPYDVIFMDVQMPERDGLEAGRAICARWSTGKRPRIEGFNGDRLSWSTRFSRRPGSRETVGDAVPPKFATSVKVWPLPPSFRARVAVDAVER